MLVSAQLMGNALGFGCSLYMRGQSGNPILVVVVQCQCNLRYRGTLQVSSLLWNTEPGLYALKDIRGCPEFSPTSLRVFCGIGEGFLTRPLIMQHWWCFQSIGCLACCRKPFGSCTTTAGLWSTLRAGWIDGCVGEWMDGRVE